MGIIFFLIGCSIFVALIFLGAFFWANKSGQHDDLYTPSVRILFDDEVNGNDDKEGVVDKGKTHTEKQTNTADNL